MIEFYSNKNLPMYPYHVRTVNGKDGLLYHYTNIESAKQILYSMKLRLSDPSNFNDPSDCSLNELALCDYTSYHRVQDMWNNIGVICFTENWRKDNVYNCGYNHPRMWAQYAGGNTGVCFVIDKQSFISENNLKNKRFFLKRMRYSNSPERYSIQYNINHKNFYSKAELHATSLFFCKNTDWRDENEIRLLGFDLPKYLSIKNSISFIVLGSKIREEDYKQIVSVVNDVNSQSYLKLGEKSFVKASYEAGNVVVNDLATCGELPSLVFVADECN